MYIIEEPMNDQPLTSSSSSSSISSSGGRVDAGPAEGESSSIAAISPAKPPISVGFEWVCGNKAKLTVSSCLYCDFSPAPIKTKAGRGASVRPEVAMGKTWGSSQTDDGSRTGVSSYSTITYTTPPAGTAVSSQPMRYPKKKMKRLEIPRKRDSTQEWSSYWSVQD